MTSKDKFGIPYFHPLKSGGFAYESSDDPKSDDPFESGNETKTTGTNEVTMSPNGPTNFHLGKNARKFKDSIGGCKLKFPDAEGRGYAAFKDDVRDVMIRGLFWFDLGSNGFSLSACTGHHTTPKPCCQGHAYMITIEPSQNPYGATFRKEMWHVSYHPSPGSGKNGFTLPGLTADQQWVGIGFCRYNDPAAPDKNVIVEVWVNSHPESDIGDWKMIKSEVDTPGHGWGDDGNQCGGAKDQVITWSGPKNRFKTNATSGKVKAKMLSMFEIDPGGTGTGGQPPGEPPQPPTTGTISRDWTMKYNIIAFGDDACQVGITATSLNTFYSVADNGSESNLHRDRYRACMFANGSASLFIGKKPRRVRVKLSKSGSPPTGNITCVLRRGNDDQSVVTYSYVGAAQLDALDLTTAKTQYTFENLTSDYVWQNGDKLCVEYSGNTDDTTNEVNVFRNTLDPYDGNASCAIKFDSGGPPPEAYSAPDLTRDYAWEISEINTPPSGEGGGGGGEEIILPVDQFGVWKAVATKAGGKEWFSTLWGNGHPRTLSTNTFDPDDAQLGFHLGSPSPTRTFVINGDGTATMPEAMAAGDTRRIFINGPWLNTEITVYARYRTTRWASFQLRSRSNHHGTQNLPSGYDSTNDISCGFGNYVVKWGEAGDNTVSTEVEVIHDLYHRHLDEHTHTLPTANNWVGYKQITRTLGSEVNVQGWINYDITDQTKWTKQTEFTFDGTNVVIDTTGHSLNISTCSNTGDPLYVTPAPVADLNGNTRWLTAGKWSWIRINGGDDVDLKFFSVREIEGVIVTPPPPPVITYQELYNVTQNGSATLNDSLKRYGELVNTALSKLNNRKPAYVEVWLAKSGSPTGNVSVTIRKGSDDSIAHTFGTKDAATLTTTLTKYKFDTNINTAYQMVVGDRIMVEYTTGTSSNTVKVGRNVQTATTSYDGTESIRIQYTTVYDGGSVDRDLAGVIWEQQ